MEFLQPLALVGLAAAVIPALLHLLQRRQPPTQVFPPVRYLVEAEERHSRRVKLHNLLLLILRTALIAAVMLAASRPVVPTPLGGAHAPSAVAVVLDNSLSAAAVADGRPQIARLRDAADAIGATAAPGDRLWLITADGIPRQVPASEWRAAVAEVRPVAGRLDVGAAVTAGAAVLGQQRLPGTVVVLSDLQASALSATTARDVRIVALDPGPAPPNRGVARVTVEPASWLGAGTVIAEIGGNEVEPAEVALGLPDGRIVRGLAGAGGSAVLAADRLGPGWHRLRVTLAPDELRADDEYHLAVRSAAPALASADGAGPFVAAAVAVLIETGRLRDGRAVVIGDRPAAGAIIVLPPADPARIAAVNQALAARGVPARFGDRRTGEWATASALLPVGGATVTSRYTLEGGRDTLATAGGAPWIVQAGPVVLVGSRLEEGWTDLPLRPTFVPFVDLLMNRSGAGEAWRVDATPGATVRLPGSARAVELPGGRAAVPPGGYMDVPAEPGVYYAVGAAGDTVGALAVNADARESDLTVADGRRARALLGTDVAYRPAGAVAAAAFAARRAELTGVLLLLALALAVGELALATFGGAVVRKGP